MTRLGFAASGLRNGRIDACLLIACIALTFFLFGLLASLRASFTYGLDEASAHRLRTQATSSLAALIPISYAERIRSAPGVDYVSYAYALPAAYQDNPSHLLLQAVPVAHLFDMFPELKTSPEEQSAFGLKKTALLVGPGALKKYGWKVGQTVSLQTNIVRVDGSATWPFEIVAAYVPTRNTIPDDLTFMRYDYLNDARGEGRDFVMGYIERIADAGNAPVISRNIDSAFKASSPGLRTEPESQALLKQLAQFGDFTKILAWVAGSVFVSMLLLLNSVISQRARDRARDFAVMRAIGFPSEGVFATVLGECLILSIIGAAAGLALAAVATEVIRHRVSDLLPAFHFPASAVWIGGGLTIVFALLASVSPARAASKTDAILLLRSL